MRINEKENKKVFYLISQNRHIYNRNKKYISKQKRFEKIFLLMTFSIMIFSGISFYNNFNENEKMISPIEIKENIIIPEKNSPYSATYLYNNYQSNRDPNTMVIDGDIMYVGNFNGDLESINISNPENFIQFLSLQVNPFF